MRQILLIFLLACTYSYGQAQTDLTTFILIRHAEKADDGTRNPGLTAEGKDRAERFKTMFAEAGVTAIYSTPYKRTKNTVAPLANSLNLEITEYDPRSREFLNEIMTNHKGGTIVVSGHSNTTPFVTNWLIGEDRFQQLSEKVYGNIYVVTVSEIGNGNVSLIKY